MCVFVREKESLWRERARVRAPFARMHHRTLLPYAARRPCRQGRDERRANEKGKRMLISCRACISCSAAQRGDRVIVAVVSCRRSLPGPARTLADTVSISGYSASLGCKCDLLL